MLDYEKDSLQSILLEWSKDHINNKKSINQSVNEMVEFYQIQNINSNMDKEEIANTIKGIYEIYIRKCITNNKFIHQELNIERKNNSSCETISDYFNYNGLEFNNVFEYQNFLLKNALTELKQC